MASLVASLDNAGTFTITAPWGTVATFTGKANSGPMSLRHAGYIVCSEETEYPDRTIWSVAKA